MKTFSKILLDRTGNGVILFALSLLLLMSTVLIVEADYAKVLLTKVSLSMIADVAASEAAKELNMNMATETGKTQIDSRRAIQTAITYIDKNVGFLPTAQIKRFVMFRGSRVEVLLTVILPLSNNKQKAVINARSSAYIRNFK